MKKVREITEIIVHCTATPEGRDVSVVEIDKWHKQRGWNGIGYHYVVYLDGTIANGRNEELPGAHCQGHNSKSIGIAYVGGVARDGVTPRDTRTYPQKAALIELLVELRAKYPNAKIRGHRDFSPKACPSFDATTEYRDI